MIIFLKKSKYLSQHIVKFRNEFALDYEDDLMSAVYADIKKYKLASSEGINK